jgi:hypothetical protein
MIPVTSIDLQRGLDLRFASFHFKFTTVGFNASVRL